MRVRGHSEGYAHDPKWTVYWYTVCEVCLSIINPLFTMYSLNRLKHKKIMSIKDSYLLKNSNKV